jgi:hypothetical protein
VGDFVIKTGDLLRVTIPAPALVPDLAGPAPLQGSSTNVTVNGASVCLVGDELPAQLRGPLTYTAPPYTNPGTGTLSLSLLPQNTTTRTRNGKALLVRGGPFTALFTVGAPATQTTPAGLVADPLTVKEGTAQFVTDNETVRAG